MPALLLLILFPFFAQAESCDMTREPERERAAKILLQYSQEAVIAGHYCQASHLYQEVILQHPLSKEAKVAQLEIIYSLAKAGNYQESERAAEDYLILFPRYKKKPQLLTFLRNLKAEEKKRAQKRRLRLDQAEFGVSGLPPPYSEPNGYQYEPDSIAIGGMLTLKIPF